MARMLVRVIPWSSVPLTVDVVETVVIDLKGFGIYGVPGSLNGIKVPGASKFLVVRDGFVSGWGGDGIQAATAVTVRLA